MAEVPQALGPAPPGAQASAFGPRAVHRVSRADRAEPRRTVRSSELSHRWAIRNVSWEAGPTAWLPRSAEPNGGLVEDPLRDGGEHGEGRAVREAARQVAALLQAPGELRIQGHGAQEGHSGVSGQLLSASPGEDMGALGAVWADEAAHVLHEPDDPQPHLPTEGQLPSHVPHRHGLGRGDHEGPQGAVGAQGVHGGHVLIRGPRGRVHNQIVQRPPGHVRHKLLYQRVLLGASPHHGLVRLLQQEAH